LLPYIQASLFQEPSLVVLRLSNRGEIYFVNSGNIIIYLEEIQFFGGPKKDRRVLARPILPGELALLIEEAQHIREITKPTPAVTSEDGSQISERGVKSECFHTVYTDVNHPSIMNDMPRNSKFRFSGESATLTYFTVGSNEEYKRHYKHIPVSFMTLKDKTENCDIKKIRK